jgi:Leucine-rich repeat (LRR) protein
MEKLDLHWKDEDPDLGIAPEGVHCKDMDEIISHISEVKDTVKIINLDNQRALKEIPAILKECELLEEINISHTDIKEIPEFLFTLPNLRSLSCCCRGLLQPPKGFSKAEKLEYLHIRINKDWVIPDEISSLENLKVLIIDLYSAAALPENLGSLKNLEDLTLAIKYDEGAVPSLPSSFNGAPALKRLSINDPFYKKRKSFDLENAGGILSSCLHLESLKLSGLAVGKGHKSLSLLTSLRILELRHLLVEGNIFDSIAGLNKLEEMDIWGSEFKITEIPDIFANLQQLEKFSFAGNMVLELPPSIYNLAKLKTLEIGSTGISVLDEKIGRLKSLEKIHIYDSILEKLPDSIYSLPSLKVLNIEENIYSSNEIASIKEKLKALEQKGQTIEFSYDGQGHRQMVKKLRAININSTMDNVIYVKHCFNAINENPYAIKYVSKDKLQGTRHYAELSIAAVRKTCFAFENIDPNMLGKTYYFYICMEAARSQDIGQVFRLIKSDLLNDEEYIQVCIEAALHNRTNDFLNYFNTPSFQKRYNREIYERICWVAVLHHPPVIQKMENPTPELQELAAKRMKK